MNLTPDDPKLTAYALGELDADERAAVEAALARSPECRRAVAEIRALGTELTTALAADAATALDALPSLAPIGGEGRGEGASRAAQSAADALVAQVSKPAVSPISKSAGRAEAERAGHAVAVAGLETRDTADLEVCATAGADAPGTGKVLFLPWRQWRTVGLAAAAAVVLGFFLAKVWRTEPAPQLVQHRVTEQTPAPLPQAPEPSALLQQPANQVAQTATNGVIAVLRTNGPSGLPLAIVSGSPTLRFETRVQMNQAIPPPPAPTGPVSVDFRTGTGTAGAGADYIAQNGTLTFAEREKLKAYVVPPIASTPATPRLYYRLPTPVPATPGLVAWGESRPALVRGVRSDDVGLVIANGPRNWAFQPDTTTTAAYPRYVENPFTLVASEPLSTFSTDVDTASYANVRRFLSQNQLPPRDAVRIEELLNYFTYDYAPPTGPHPFAAHIEVAGCPWAPEHRLVRVGLKGRELKADKRPPSNFVFLIDVSGSMGPAARLPLIKQSLRQLVKRMTEDDRVAMVVYASSSGTVLESTSAVHKERILSAIDRLEAGGSTNGGEGIQRAYDLAAANFIKGGVNRVLLCTDGDFNVGITDRGQLLKLIEEKAKSGVFLTTLGVGDDNFKDATLQQLADKGNGNYHYLDTVAEGHKVLVEQMNATLVTIAKDVKIQIEFNPAQAAAYRLIGYEKRILAKEDFNNDAKDAGEIGAGHTVTALYEVVPAGVPVRGAVDPLKYQPNSQPAPAPVAPAPPTAKAKGTSVSKELLTLKLRYKAPDGDTSKLVEFPLTDGGAAFARASADFKFASAVAEFGMLLKDSPFKGTASFDSALKLAHEGKGNDTHGYRAEFLTLLAKAKELKK
jgi:Ca-activated chloride channel family protein